MTTTQWRKSSHSGASNECIEVRSFNNLIEVRESDRAETILRMSPGAFTMLLEGIKIGAFDQHSRSTT
ncbi:DUF397 domain-containing protein [Kitasatospora sp. NPDC057692]|uniref:DUF397 domain-containing protein n=1 Tax=Kitasatospora sp. NPDC057692 TaxID=3346215 RepID=UPI0036BE7C3F